jgi:hypothetical protein
MEIKHMTTFETKVRTERANAKRAITHRASTLRRAQEEVRRLWVLQCGWDCIPHTAPFVTFSSTNPFTQPYQKAMAKFMRLRRNVQSAADLRAQHNMIVRFLAETDRCKQAVR